MKKVKIIKLKRNKNIVGKCKIIVDDGDIAWIEKVMIYKRFRGLKYSFHLISKAINYIKKNEFKICVFACQT